MPIITPVELGSGEISTHNFTFNHISSGCRRPTETQLVGSYTLAVYAYIKIISVATHMQADVR